MTPKSIGRPENQLHFGVETHFDPPLPMHQLVWEYNPSAYPTLAIHPTNPRSTRAELTGQSIFFTRQEAGIEKKQKHRNTQKKQGNRNKYFSWSRTSLV